MARETSPWVLPTLVVGGLLAVCGVAAAVILMPRAKPAPTVDPVASVPSLPLAAPSASPQRTFNHSLAITSRYDEFEDRSSYRAELGEAVIDRDAPIPTMTVSLNFGHAGKRLTESPRSFILSIGTAPQPDGGLIVLADGERLPFDTPINRGSMRYWSTAIVPSKDLVTMLRADVVRCRLGGWEFAFSDEQREAMRDFVTRLDPDLLP